MESLQTDTISTYEQKKNMGEFVEEKMEVDNTNLGTVECESSQVGETNIDEPQNNSSDQNVEMEDNNVENKTDSITDNLKENVDELNGTKTAGDDIEHTEENTNNDKIESSEGTNEKSESSSEIPEENKLSVSEKVRKSPELNDNSNDETTKNKDDDKTEENDEQSSNKEVKSSDIENEKEENQSSEKFNDSDKTKEDKADVSDHEEEEKEQQNKNDKSVNEKGTSSENKPVSLLQQKLMESTPPQNGEGDDSEFNGDDMDEDFDPSLLCPEVHMEEEETPVITQNDNVPNDGSTSPLLYEPVFSTFVDEMTGAEITFNLSPDEHALRQRMFGSRNPIQYTKIHCTACNVHLGSALEGQKNRFVHPMLKVLICKECYHFYTSGEFEKDEDGSELYCRWCGQGGQVLCCSRCEFVFCKKCIRINFGRRKLAEVTASDDWDCFRCDPSQLTMLRVSCAELFEYVRRETSRASTLNMLSFLTTDHTTCCSAAVAVKHKLPPEPEIELSEKKRKKKKHEDPDYNPIDEILEEQEQQKENQQSSSAAGPTSPAAVAAVVKTEPSSSVANQKLVPIQPKPVQKWQQGFRLMPNPVRSQGPRPMVSTPNNAGVRVRPQNFLQVLPPPLRQLTPNRPPPLTPSPSMAQRPARLINSDQPNMKHEWFEKTVRAAARVNSNLSYTLTQLNRAQAQASSVEQLAVVHNKLQEILSTSINSLIQIRKNLRTEFIAGIKTIRFPPKKPAEPPSAPPANSSNDDDVIFVSSPTQPVNNNSTIVINKTLPSLSPAVTLTAVKKNNTNNDTQIKNKLPTSSPPPSNAQSPSVSTLPPRMFLKVRSFSALQNVSAECITIPDDPVPIKSEESPKEKEPPILIEEDVEKNAAAIQIRISSPKTVLEDDDECVMINDTEEIKTSDKLTNGDIHNDNDDKDDTNDSKEVSSDLPVVTVNLKEDPSPEVVRMCSVKILVDRSKDIDELLKKESTTNGEVSE